MLKDQTFILPIFLYIEAIFDRETVQNAQMSMCPPKMVIYVSKNREGGGGQRPFATWLGQKGENMDR